MADALPQTDNQTPEGGGADGGGVNFDSLFARAQAALRRGDIPALAGLASGFQSRALHHLLGDDPDDRDIHRKTARIQCISDDPADRDHVAAGTQHGIDATNSGQWS